MSQSGNGQPPGPGAPFGGTQLMPLVESPPNDGMRPVPGYGMPPPQEAVPQAPVPQHPQPPQYAQPPQPQGQPYVDPSQQQPPPSYGQPQPYVDPSQQYGQPQQPYVDPSQQYGQPQQPYQVGQYAQPPVIASPQTAGPRPLPPGYAGGPQLQQAAMPPQGAPRPSHSEDVPEQGFWVERMKGLKMLGSGAALLALNIGSLIFLEQYYIITTVAMLPLFFGGGWQVVFGDEYDDRTHEIVMWKRVGFYGCIGFGVLCGLGLLVLLNL